MEDRYKYLVKVEKKHIEAGRKRDARACPVALAIRDSIPLLEEVEVYDYWIIKLKRAGKSAYLGPHRYLTIKLKRDKKSIHLKPPYWLSERIDEYDDWGKMEPFSFIIDLYRNKISPE